MSSPDLLQTPITTTAPDDVFYILKTVASRLLTTGSCLGMDQILTQLKEVFERDYIGVIKRKMDDVYRNAGPTSSTRPDRVEKENRVAFIVRTLLIFHLVNLFSPKVQLNDLDVSNSHLERLVHDLAESSLITQHFQEVEQLVVKEKLLSLNNLSLRLKSSLRVSTTLSGGFY